MATQQQQYEQYMATWQAQPLTAGATRDLTDYGYPEWSIRRTDDGLLYEVLEGDGFHGYQASEYQAFSTIQYIVAENERTAWKHDRWLANYHRAMGGN